MKTIKILTAASILTALMYGSALASPTAQINIPSTNAKGLGEVAIAINNYTHFSNKADARDNSYSTGFETGLLPYETVKLEVGLDYATTGKNSPADAHPFYLNAKLATAEDLGVKGMPAFAVGIYNMGTYDKPEIGVSTRQNIAYGMVARTLLVVGRISVGGYVASERALRTSGNPQNNNSGLMASWDRTICEISDKLWMGVEYMSGNNANGEISVGASWSFSKQVNLLAGVLWYNPFYKLSASDNGAIPGGKPAFTTQLTLNLP